MTRSAERRGRDSRRRPTINDVARLSQVSKSTVSNVLRDSAGVSPATRERVLGAIDILGYRPNAAARQLVARRAQTIGVVSGDLANSFNAELLKGIEAAASPHGYMALVCNTEGHPDREAARIDALLKQGVDGIALLEFSGDRRVVSELLTRRVPTVMLACASDYADSVAVDDQAGIEMGIEHLIALGHRKIAYVDDALVEPGTREARLRGFDMTMLRHGLPATPDLVVTWDEDALAAVDRALAELFTRTDRPTAVMTADDAIAIRLMEACEAKGLGVPDDISVVGFDGIAIAGLSRISLTTIVQPQQEITSWGIEMLVERIEGDHGGAPQQHFLRPKLAVRDSTAPPPAADRPRSA
jgi:LacI family transcriptional regulator